MKMSQSDVEFYLSDLPRTIAKELKIKDYEFFNSEELDDKISEKDIEVWKKLREFKTVYRKWWQFQVDNDEAIETGRLAPPKHQESMSLILERDKVRQELIDVVRKK